MSPKYYIWALKCSDELRVFRAVAAAVMAHAAIKAAIV